MKDLETRMTAAHTEVDYSVDSTEGLSSTNRGFGTSQGLQKCTTVGIPTSHIIFP